MSDGAAAAVVMSAERAKALGIKPLARYVLSPPQVTSPKKWGWAQCSQSESSEDGWIETPDIEVIELTSLAAQSLAVIKEAGLDPEKVNPNGGAIALDIRWAAPEPS